MNVRLTENRALVIRPIVTIVNSWPTSIRTGAVNEQPGSATPLSHLRFRVPYSAVGSCDGRKTNQMSGGFNYTHVFEKGWTLGTRRSNRRDLVLSGEGESLRS